MKIKILYASLTIFLLWLFTSCNSTGYEIEEVEDDSDTSIIASRNEIKQEIEQPKNEIKSDPSVKKENENTTYKTEPQFYTIQFGAFNKESNAVLFTEKVKATLNISVTYTLINGMYKVRTGQYSNLDEAILLLSKVKDSGFEAFITKVNK